MRLTSVPPWLFWTLAVFASVAAGALVSLPGLLVWDDWSLYKHSRWVLHQYGLLAENPPVSENAPWTAALWPLFLGIMTEYAFAWLRDPYLVRHAFTFALLPLTLLLVPFLLRKAAVPPGTCLLASALLFSYIRFGGHALVSARDFPHAAGFLIAIIGVWLLLRRGARNGWNIGLLLGLGALSVLPLLLRSPNLLPLPLVLVLLASKRGHPASAPWNARAMSLAIAASAGAVLVFAFSPALWGNLRDALYPLELFASFPWTGTVRAFGESFRSTELPLWYYPVWLFVGMHPVGFVAVIVGWALLLWNRRTKAKEFLALESWIGLIMLVAWASVFILRPDVYDEDRHLLFLFPPLVVLAALGYEHTSDRLLYGLSTAVMLVAIISYAQWGVFSYAYKSPFIADRSAEAFMGDHRGVCLNAAIRHLQTLALPDGIPLWFPEGPSNEAQAQSDRLGDSALIGNKSPSIHATLVQPVQKPYLVLIYNRMDIKKDIESSLSSADPVKLWSLPMPYGNNACEILLINAV